MVTAGLNHSGKFPSKLVVTEEGESTVSRMKQGGDRQPASANPATILTRGLTEGDAMDPDTPGSNEAASKPNKTSPRVTIEKDGAVGDTLAANVKECAQARQSRQMNLERGNTNEQQALE